MAVVRSAAAAEKKKAVVLFKRIHTFCKFFGRGDVFARLVGVVSIMGRLYFSAVPMYSPHKKERAALPFSEKTRGAIAALPSIFMLNSLLSLSPKAPSVRTGLFFNRHIKHLP